VQRTVHWGSCVTGNRGVAQDVLRTHYLDQGLWPDPRSALNDYAIATFQPAKDFNFSWTPATDCHLNLFNQVIGINPVDMLSVIYRDHAFFGNY
jgi:hypothetical protein